MKSSLLNMIKINRLTFIIVLSVGITFASQTRAATVIIDFDDAGEVCCLTGDYLEDGFLMQSLSGHYDIWGSGGTDDTPYLGLDQVDGPSEVRFTGGIFNLVSLDVMSGADPEFGELQTLTSSAGGNIALNTVGIQTFTGPDWSNLTSINLFSNIGIGGPGFDTITFNTVPIPPALYLFTSGLLGLIGIARKRKAA